MYFRKIILSVNIRIFGNTIIIQQPELFIVILLFVIVLYILFWSMKSKTLLGFYCGI